MKKISYAACAVTAAALGAATSAFAGQCTNTCTTLAIPSGPGVQTRLDGSADAALWPPSHELRRIDVAALNDRGIRCDVTIEDVRQDEQPATARNGARIEDATNCHNDGKSSSIELRSDRSDNGDGRSYQIRISLVDPECNAAARADELLVVVPREPTVADLKPEIDEGQLTASYSGPELQCTPAADDRISRSGPRS